ncbi:MAG: hypothetical protein ACRDJF_00805, partial [Actinomycetota bacterium]
MLDEAADMGLELGRPPSVEQSQDEPGGRRRNDQQGHPGPGEPAPRQQDQQDPEGRDESEHAAEVGPEARSAVECDGDPANEGRQSDTVSGESSRQRRGCQDGRGGEDREHEIPQAGEPAGNDRGVAHQARELQAGPGRQVERDHEDAQATNEGGRAARPPGPRSGERQPGDQRGGCDQDRGRLPDPQPLGSDPGLNQGRHRNPHESQSENPKHPAPVSPSSRQPPPGHEIEDELQDHEHHEEGAHPPNVEKGGGLQVEEALQATLSPRDRPDGQAGHGWGGVDAEQPEDPRSEVRDGDDAIASGGGGGEPSLPNRTHSRHGHDHEPLPVGGPDSRGAEDE